MARRFMLVALVMAVAAGAAIWGPGGPETSKADPVAVRAINPSLCFAFLDDPTTLEAGCTNFNDLVWSRLSGNEKLMSVANQLGDNDGIIEASDFDSVAELGANQIHQRSFEAGPPARTLNKLAVIAFVDADAPVTFRTNAGSWLNRAGSPVGQIAVCRNRFAFPAGNIEDPDCGGGPSTSPDPRLREDQVVVAYLTCTSVTCPERGTFQFSFEQNGIVFPVDFTVVGEARRVEFFSLESEVQAGVPDLPTGEADCEFRADPDFVIASLGQAEKTVLVARALDIDNTAITGAWIQWSSSDEESVAIAQSPITPSIDLGAFGFGAPNIICARIGATPGEYQVEAQIIQSFSGIPLDPMSIPASREFDLTVQGLPEVLTVIADPAQIVCDGQNTSTVRAALSDAEGNPALSGTEVRFDAQVLATADPLVAMTNAEGVATSAISPFSGVARGATVIVTVPVTGEQQAILVGCVQPAVVEPEPEEPAPPAVPPTGIIPPSTGTGPLVPDGGGTPGWWPVLTLLAGAMTLGGARLAVRRA